MRTFYAGLFKAIRKEDLYYNGSFFPMCADVATMIPMAEMAWSHVRFISNILLIYNDGNNLSFFHNKREEQITLHKEISSRTPYEPLKELPFLK